MEKSIIMSATHKFSNGVTVVNTTPHPVNMQDVNGELVSVPSCEQLILNAQTEEVQVSPLFVRTAFIGTAEGEKLINNILISFNGNENVIIVGSIIAAQAYPGKVCGLCPVPGFERVAPAEKRMRCDKFTIF